MIYTTIIYIIAFTFTSTYSARNYKRAIKSNKKMYSDALNRFIVSEQEADKHYKQEVQSAYNDNIKLVMKNYTALYDAYTTVFEREAARVKAELDQLTGRVVTVEEAKKRNELKTVLEYLDERGAHDASRKS